MKFGWIFAAIVCIACCGMAIACDSGDPNDGCGCDVKVNVFTYVEVTCEGGECGNGDGNSDGNSDGGNGGGASGNGGGATQGDTIPNYYNGGRNGVGFTGVRNGLWENPAARIGLGSVEVKEGCENTVLVGILSTGLSKAHVGLWSIVVETQDNCFNTTFATYLIPHDTDLPAGQFDSDGAIIPGFKIFPVRISGVYYSVKLLDADGNEVDHINYAIGDGLKIFSLTDGVWQPTLYSTEDIGRSLNF